MCEIGAVTGRLRIWSTSCPLGELLEFVHGHCAVAFTVSRGLWLLLGFSIWMWLRACGFW
jgi:hypothetical protein